MEDEIVQVMELLREKLGTRGKTLNAALRKARYRMPRRIYQKAIILAKAEPLVGHPKLRQTLDMPRLSDAAAQVRAHLQAIDTADRRKGWILGMLGGLSFNLLAFGVLLVVVLMWRGFL